MREEVSIVKLTIWPGYHLCLLNQVVRFTSLLISCVYCYLASVLKRHGRGWKSVFQSTEVASRDFDLLHFINHLIVKSTEEELRFFDLPVAQNCDITYCKNWKKGLKWITWLTVVAHIQLLGFDQIFPCWLSDRSNLFLECFREFGETDQTVNRTIAFEFKCSPESHKPSASLHVCSHRSPWEIQGHKSADSRPHNANTTSIDWQRAEDRCSRAKRSLAAYRITKKAFHAVLNLECSKFGLRAG